MVRNEFNHLSQFAQSFFFFSRACIVCHFCQNNCFFILLSWLPTYFHDNFPGSKSWIFNVVPWLLMVPGIAFASYVVNKLLVRGYSVGTARKVAESLCLGTEVVCLVSIGKDRCNKLIFSTVSDRRIGNDYRIKFATFVQIKDRR